MVSQTDDKERRGQVRVVRCPTVFLRIQTLPLSAWW